MSSMTSKRLMSGLVASPTGAFLAISLQKTNVRFSHFPPQYRGRDLRKQQQRRLKYLPLISERRAHVGIPIHGLPHSLEEPRLAVMRMERLPRHDIPHEQQVPAQDQRRHLPILHKLAQTRQEFARAERVYNLVCEVTIISGRGLGLGSFQDGESEGKLEVNFRAIVFGSVIPIMQ